MEERLGEGSLHPPSLKEPHLKQQQIYIQIITQPQRTGKFILSSLFP